MRIRHLMITGLRGVKHLDWKVEGTVSCLIGAGDSCKSTILRAVELVLSSRWEEPIDDADFFNCDPSNPITVEATICCPPAALQAEKKFGLHLRGWSPTGGLNDEPAAGDHLALTVRLTITDSLEPEWVVITNRTPDGVAIKSQDRAHFNLLRLQAEVDRHLSWSRGSLLYRLGSTVDGGYLARVGRLARAGAPPHEIPELQAITKRVEELVAPVGVRPTIGFQPAFDPSRVVAESSDVVLADGAVPGRCAGTGTRRLMCMALQRETKDGHGITLVDEVEFGLEPHRLRHLLHWLSSPPAAAPVAAAAAAPAAAAAASAAAAAAPSPGTCSTQPQIFMTTHSSTAVVELKAEDLCVARRKPDGHVALRRVPARLQAVIRRAPDALLARKVVVCEGRTEQGLVRKLDPFWAEQKGSPFAYLGVVAIDGQGTSAPQTAADLQELGYAVALLADSDAPLSPTAAQLGEAGVRVLLWADNLAIEQRLATDLPWASVQQLVRFAMTESSDVSVRDKVASVLKVLPAVLSLDPMAWPDTPANRSSIGKAAMDQKWFKTIERGERLADVVLPALASIAASDTAIKIAALRTWIYDA